GRIEGRVDRADLRGEPDGYACCSLQHLHPVCQVREREPPADFRTDDQLPIRGEQIARPSRNPSWQQRRRIPPNPASRRKCAAYERAVALNASLPASWKALAVLYRSVGQIDQCEFAERQADRLARLPAPVVTGWGMLAEGDVYGAEAVVRHFLQTHGNNVEAMRLLARIGEKLDVLDDAEFLLESVLVFAPDYLLARYDYADVLCKRHKHAQALLEARKLLEVEPANRAFRTMYATACVGLGNHEEAVRAFRELLVDAPETSELHMSIGHALKTLGRQPEAIASYRAAAAARPSFG